MEGGGGDYLISLRKEGSHRSRSIVRVALIAPGVRCKSWYCGLTHFRQASFPPHVDPPFPRRSQNVLAPRLLRINAVIVIALAVDLAAAIGWLRRRSHGR